MSEVIILAISMVGAFISVSSIFLNARAARIRQETEYELKVIEFRHQIILHEQEICENFLKSYGEMTGSYNHKTWANFRNSYFLISMEFSDDKEFHNILKQFHAIIIKEVFKLKSGEKFSQKSISRMDKFMNKHIVAKIRESLEESEE